MMAPKITGQVAQILNDRQLVINRGAEHGVELGMRFKVLNPKGQDIRDPETGDQLGSLHQPKIRVEVTDVRDKMSVASTFETQSRNVGGIGFRGIDARMFEPPKYVREYKSFDSSEALWRDIDEAQSLVQVGDPVEQIMSDLEGDFVD